MLSSLAQVMQACHGREIPGGEAKQLEEQLAALRSRIQARSPKPTQGDWGDPERVRCYARTLRQILLHRAIHLYEGALDALVAGNPYVMILAIRGFFETTAALGYLHRRLASAAAGDLDLATVDRDIVGQVVGTQDKKLGAIEGMAKAVNVLTMMIKADETVAKHVTDGPIGDGGLLQASYDWLCEWAHPNFHSNQVAISINAARDGMTHSYEPVVADREFATLGHLQLGADLYVELHDGIEQVLPK